MIGETPDEALYRSHDRDHDPDRDPDHFGFRND